MGIAARQAVRLSVAPDPRNLLVTNSVHWASTYLAAANLSYLLRHLTAHRADTEPPFRVATPQAAA